MRTTAIVSKAVVLLLILSSNRSRHSQNCFSLLFSLIAIRVNDKIAQPRQTNKPNVSNLITSHSKVIYVSPTNTGTAKSNCGGTLYTYKFSKLYVKRMYENRTFIILNKKI